MRKMKIRTAANLNLLPELWRSFDILLRWKHSAQLFLALLSIRPKLPKSIIRPKMIRPFKIRPKEAPPGVSLFLQFHNNHLIKKTEKENHTGNHTKNNSTFFIIFWQPSIFFWKTAKHMFTYFFSSIQNH
jgi:hypothetical protein